MPSRSSLLARAQPWLVLVSTVVLLGGAPPLAAAAGDQNPPSLEGKLVKLPPGVAAMVDAAPVPIEEFQDHLVDRYLSEPIGKQAFEQVIDECVVDIEALRRAISVSAEQIERKVAELDGQVRAAQSHSLEQELADKGIDPDDFRALLKKSMAHEIMARQDFGLGASEMVPPEKLKLWLTEHKSHVAVVREGLPPRVLAMVEGKPITTTEVGRALSKVIDAGELRKALTELIGIRLIERRVAERKLELTAADLDREIESRDRLLKHNSSVEGVSYATLLHAQGRSVEELQRTRRFRAEVALGKMCDQANGEAELEAYWTEHQAEFTAVYATTHRIATIFLKAVEYQNQFQLRTFKDADQELGALKERIAAGTSFKSLAHIYSEHASRQNDGDLGFIGPSTKGMEPLYKAVAPLEVGAIAGPVHTGDGTHLVMLTDKRAPPGYEDLREEVRREVRQDYYRDLFKNVKIERRY
ncbi:MAG: peptidylprolyl isomerase [Planctomycetota bacterium]